MTRDEREAARDSSERETKPRTDRDVGHALRSVYVETVNEEVPSDLLDLLGKLG